MCNRTIPENDEKIHGADDRSVSVDSVFAASDAYYRRTYENDHTVVDLECALCTADSRCGACLITYHL